jgi:hypothetical protein
MTKKNTNAIDKNANTEISKSIKTQKNTKMYSTKDIENEIVKLKIEVEGNDANNIMQNFKIDTKEFKNVSPETMNTILDILKKYVNMDKSFRLKHETLKMLYNAYLDLYKKYKENQKNNSENGNFRNEDKMISNIINKSGKEITENTKGLSDSEHTDMLNTIHSEMKENNTNLYRNRLLILKKIKDTPDINQDIKNKLCGRLIAIFRKPPNTEYNPIPLLGNMSSNISSNMSDSDIGNIPENSEEKINVKELDDAYLQKHNELMTVYKAYHNLYNKILNYKSQLDEYKRLPTGSSISRSHMEKLLGDQRFVMNMIDKMQNKLVNNKILNESDKIPVSPVISHPENMGVFNDTIRGQIQQIIDRNVDINPNIKTQIQNLLGQYKTCESNDTFCKKGRELLLIRK